MATLVTQDLTVPAGEVRTYAQNTDYSRMAALLIGWYEATVGETYFEPTVINYGEMHLDDAGFGTGQLLYFTSSLSWNYGVTKNYGLMSAVVPAASSIRVLFGPSWSPDVFNYGTIVAEAQNDSIGYETWDGGSLFANGPDAIVRARGAERALALYFPNGGRITNDGQLLAHVTGGGHAAVPDMAAAVQFGWGSLFSESSLVNTGLIQATGTSPAHLVDAIAIRGETRFSLVNSGTIRGTNAIAQYNSGQHNSSNLAVSIENRGTIEGRVILGVGNDTFVNHGQMAGSVDLGAGDDLYDGAAGTLTGPVRGGAGNDRMTAGAGDQQLVGDDGDDSLQGGSGNDSLDGGAGLDTAYYATAGAGVTVSLAAAGAQATGGAGSDTLTSIENLSGSHFGDVLTGNDLANHLHGGGGDDRLAGGGGADRLEGGAGGDVFVFGAVSDSTSAAPDRIVDFEPGVDKIDLLALGPVSLTWQSVVDGTGAYTLVSAAAAAGTLVVRVDSAQPLQRSDFLAAGNPTEGDDELVGTDGADTIDGLGGNDRIDGLLGADRLSGGSGDDTFSFSAVQIASPTPPAGTIDGGTGFDTIDLRGISPVTLGTSEAGFAIWVGSQMFAVTGIERILLGPGDEFAYLPADRAEALEIRGGAGSDYLSGSGAYSLYGEEGDDRFFVSGTFGAPRLGRVDGGAGTDLLKTNIGFTVDLQAGTAQAYNASYAVSGIEDVVVILSGYAASVSGDDLANRFSVDAYGDDGSAGVTFDGRGGNDSLAGGAGNDRLDGGAGADLLAGGPGNDLYFVDSGDSVVEVPGGGTDEVRTALAAYTLADEIEILTGLAGTGQALTGNGLANLLTGGAGDDWLSGGDGGDELRSGSGADRLDGGAGNDVLYFGPAFTTADRADGGDGRDAVVLQGHYTLVLSDTTLIGVESISLQSGANTRFGDTANNFYDFDITTANGNVAAGEQLIVNGQSLRAGEDFTFDGSAQTDGKFLVYGGHGGDDLTGGAGVDVFFFEGQRWSAGDRVDGGAGRDALVISAGSGLTHIAFEADSFANIESISVNNRYATDPSQKPSYQLVLHNGNVAAGGTLIINGSSLALGQVVNVNGSGVQDGALILFGGGGHDVLTGGAGADLIVGGGGADALTGGAGADIFRYDSSSNSTAGLPDLIGDFLSGTDRIDLSRIDANTATAGDQAFAWIGAAAFSGAAGELRTYEADGYRWVAGDTNGDGNADLVIALGLGTAPLVPGDFLL